MAGNPSVPQPGLAPDLMSLRPAIASLYNQGFRNPSGFFPFEIKKSLSSEIMPATVCTLAVSWMLAEPTTETGASGEWRKTHRCRCACAARGNGIGVDDDPVLERLRCDVGDPAAGRAVKTTKLQSKNRSGQVTEENALIHALILFAETPEEFGHRFLLVVGARKIVRETARGEVRCDLGE